MDRSSGLDAGAKRVVWKALRAVSEGGAGDLVDDA